MVLILMTDGPRKLALHAIHPLLPLATVHAKPSRHVQLSLYPLVLHERGQRLADGKIDMSQ